MLDVNWRWKRFQWFECVDRFGQANVKYVSPLLLDRFEELGDRLEQKHQKRVRLIMNNWKWGGNLEWRGFRSREGNIAVGGQSGSFHLHGAAGDCHSPDISAEEIYKESVKLFGGVILYQSRGFVHNDVRNGPTYHAKV